MGNLGQELEKVKQQFVCLGWTADDTHINVDALWESQCMKARSPEYFHERG